MGNAICSLEDCNQPRSARGMCRRHYARWWRGCDPEVRTWYDVPAHERFFDNVDAEGDCWLWLGGCFPNGYGRFESRGRRFGAHRWAWEYLVGAIPGGLQLDHLCRVRA